MTDLQHGQMTDLLQNDLKHNADVRAISFAIQKEKQRILALEAKTRTLSMIDELDGPILDVLSVELRIPYYSQVDSVERKRTIVKTAMLWYYKAGTVEGLMTALRAVHGGSSIEEWFQYGGNPGYFRVGIDITDPEEVLDLNWLTGIVNAYKSARSHLDDDAIAFRSVQELLIGLSTGYVVYEAPRCGTYPGPATVGGIGTAHVSVHVAPEGTAYSTPKTGTAVTGTHPKNSTVGAAAKQDVMISGETVGIGYATPKTGTAVSGTHPVQTTVGGTALQGISVEGDAQGTEYTVPKSGTVPGPATAGAAGESGMKASVTGDGTTYSGPVCGGNNLF